MDRAAYSNIKQISGKAMNSPCRIPLFLAKRIGSGSETAVLRTAAKRAENRVPPLQTHSSTLICSERALRRMT